MLDATTERVIACCFKVHNTLGAGFLEKVYQNSLMMELTRAGLAAQQRVPIAVKYDGAVVGEYFADMVVDGRLICELKAVEFLSKDHEVQLVNYLVATGFDIGLLINFGKSVTIRRKYRKYSPAAGQDPSDERHGRVA